MSRVCRAWPWPARPGDRQLREQADDVDEQRGGGQTCGYGLSQTNTWNGEKSNTGRLILFAPTCDQTTGGLRYFQLKREILLSLILWGFLLPTFVIGVNVETNIKIWQNALVVKYVTCDNTWHACDCVYVISVRYMYLSQLLQVLQSVTFVKCVAHICN